MDPSESSLELRRTVSRRKPNCKRKKSDDKRAEPASTANTSKSFLVEHRGNCIFTFILLITIFSFYDFVAPEQTIDVTAIKADLLRNVHNQTDALNVIFEVLDQMNSSDRNINAVNFVGSSGVGKTFVANILKKFFNSAGQALSNSLHHDTVQEVISQLRRSNYRYHLIVVDDLTVVDVDNVLQFLGVMPEDVFVIAVFIYNIQETDDHLNYNINYKHVDTIVERFDDVNVSQKLARFHEFSNEQAVNWVIKQLTDEGVNSGLHSNIVDSIFADQDVKYQGLKRLSSKIRATFCNI